MMRKKSWRQPGTVLFVAIGFCLVLTMIVALRAEGRHFFCSCNQFLIWVGDVCGSSNSQQLFDPFSFTHILHGFLLFCIISLLFTRMAPRWQLLLAMVSEAAWEIFENTPFVINRYRAETAALGYQGDTIINSFGDLMCAFVGFVIARRLGFRRSAIVFLIVEVILVISIRDSLLLEILMLIFPIDAMKHWQLCR
jgi:hypothetical protein